MILQQSDITAARKHFADLIRQGFAARHIISGNLNILADPAHGRQEVKIRRLADNGKSHESRRMCMEHRIQIRPHFVDREMERQLGRRFVRAFHCSVRMDADNVLSGERTLVNAARSNPDVTAGILDRQVAAGHGGHALVVDTLHKHDELVSRMDVLDIHVEPPEIILTIYFIV